MQASPTDGFLKFTPFLLVTYFFLIKKEENADIEKMITYPAPSQNIQVKKPSKSEQIKTVKVYYQKLLDQGKNIDQIRQKIVQETGVVI